MRRHTSIFLSFLLLFLFNISFALTKKDFEFSMNFYQKLVEKKVSVEELIFTLEKIMNKYKDIGIDLSSVKGKLLTLRAFKNSQDQYRKLEERGGSLDERITTLKRILIRFRNIDVDLSGMEKKLEQLEELKTGKKEEIEQVEEFRLEEGTAVPKIKKEVKESKLEEKKVEKLEEKKSSGSEIEKEFEEFKP